MRSLFVVLFLVAIIPFIHGHEIETGDPVHDANLQHDMNAGPTVNTKEVSSWEEAAPFVIVLFGGLAVFAFAIGLFLHPGKHGS